MLPRFFLGQDQRNEEKKTKTPIESYGVFVGVDVTLRQDACFISVPRMCPILFMASHSCGIAHTWCLPYATRMKIGDFVESLVVAYGMVATLT